MSFTFEFHAYPGADDGIIGADAIVTTEIFKADSAARAHAGRMAKKICGPVDIALHGKGHWDDRYLTTAAPSQFHATGYRFERLS